MEADCGSPSAMPLDAEQAMGCLLKAANFAACKHEDQRRKGRRHRPYVNHLLRVTEMLWEVGGVRDLDTLVAAMLHDTLEDTDTTVEEIKSAFGPVVLSLVQEMTDDKSLPKAVRKQLQIEHAAHLSKQAKVIKLADKIHNVSELSQEPPADWPRSRIVAYIDWSDKVVAGLRGTNLRLEAAYDEVVCAARAALPAIEESVGAGS